MWCLMCSYCPWQFWEDIGTLYIFKDFLWGGTLVDIPYFHDAPGMFVPPLHPEHLPPCGGQVVWMQFDCVGCFLQAQWQAVCGSADCRLQASRGPCGKPVGHNIQGRLTSWQSLDPWGRPTTSCRKFTLTHSPAGEPNLSLAVAVVCFIYVSERRIAKHTCWPSSTETWNVR